jgi:UDP-N-acetylglucosamine/UDP-N-acetylgalactosamine diphosphorylase
MISTIGCFNIRLPSQKSLFQLMCEKIARLKFLAKRYRQQQQQQSTTSDANASSSTSEIQLPFFIMTSDATHAQTVKFFAENNFFGLPKDQVICFQQGMLPALDFGGKILLESKGKVAMSPNGNGTI